MSKFGLKPSLSPGVAHPPSPDPPTIILERSGREDTARCTRTRALARFNSIYHDETISRSRTAAYTRRANDCGNRISARKSRIIILRCASRRRKLVRHIRQCSAPSIERQYEAAYLSLFLLLSRAHFYERIHQPDYRWSLYSAYGFFAPEPAPSRRPALFLSVLSILATVLSYPIHPNPLPFLRQHAGFPASMDARQVPRET